MESLLNSFLLVAFSEMGDKTQLLALILACRYKKPWPIMGGILVATLINHGLVSYLGAYTGALLSPDVLKWTLFFLFLGFGIWILIPDKDDSPKEMKSENVFFTTAGLFFLAEIGDKTQLATLALSANYQNPLNVTMGTTLGMLFSDGLAVIFGDHVLKKVPMLWVRRAASILFALFAIGIVLGY